MKTLIILVLMIVNLPPAFGATRQVGPGQTYTTIGACLSAMVAGDTCNVHAGTYTETPTIPAGTAGNYNTLQANASDVVTIVGSVTMNSHNKLLGNCVAPSTQGTCGFSIQNPSSPNSAPCITINSGGVTDYWVTNNNFYACGNGGYMLKEDFSSNTTFGYIQGNTFSYSCSTSSAPNVCTAMVVNGDNHLIEGNYFSHVSDGPYVFGKHNVLRGNNLGPTTDADCGSNSGGNCHIDFMQADANVVGGAQPAQFLLMENNTVHDMVVTGVFAGAGAHAGPLLQAEACSGQCFNAILRFHTAYHIAGGGSTNDNSGTQPTLANPAWYNFKSYNNDWVDVLNTNSAAGAGVNLHDYGSYGGANYNEIYYLPHNGAGNQTNPYACIPGHVTSGPDACTPFTYGYSDAFCAGSSPCTLYGHTYGSGAFTSDTGNISVDPLFNNYSLNDFTLKSGSPALNAGTNLTTVASGDTGSGTSLIVDDAGYFQAASSLVGVQSDCISVTTVGNHVCITAINYSTNTLTMATGFSRSHGDAVWLYSDSKGKVQLTGAAPNMGSQSGVKSAVNPSALILTGSQ